MHGTTVPCGGIKMSYYSKDDSVSVYPMSDYSVETARIALRSVLEPLGGLNFIKDGSRVVIKANLVSAMKPEEAATTHPTLLCALCDMLCEKGCEVVIGDSPGGLYNAAFVGRVYRVSGMQECVAHGARLNDDYSQRTAEFPEGKVLKSFTYTGYLDQADYIINFSKLKSHGMMGMSCAAKNMFGTIPGIIKPEYHFRFPKYEDFADMIVDLDEYFHPILSIADAVVGMEGNGPTAGTPKRMNCVLASRSPHCLDTAAAELLGFKREELPILDAAYRRGLAPESFSELKVFGDVVDQGGFAAMILLCGITVNAAIYLLDEYGNIRERHPQTDSIRAYLKAWNVKIVPIMLTVLSTVLGFIPFILGEQKEAFWFPLAAGTIGGLVMSLVGVFVFLPIYTLKVKKTQ